MEGRKEVLVLLALVVLAGFVSAVDTCGTISSSLTLSNDLSSPGATCITFGADNIYLDCAGHSITGDYTGSTYGVLASGKVNVTAKNCVISRFRRSVYYTATNSSIIQNLTSSSSQYAVYMSGFSNNNSVSDVSQVNGTATGLYLTFVYGSNFTNFMLINHTSYGVSVANSENDTFNNFTIQNASYGFYVGSTSSNISISNSSISQPVNGDINTATNTVNLFYLNMTFNQSNFAWGSCNPCNMTVQWYARINTSNGGGLPASVNVSDVNGKSDFSGTAGANGLTPWFIVSDYTTTKSDTTLTNATYNNHTVNASYTGYGFNTTSFNFTSPDNTVNLTLYSTSETWDACLARARTQGCTGLTCNVETVDGLPLVISTPSTGIHVLNDSYNFLCGVDGTGAIIQVANLSGSSLYAMNTSNIDIRSYTNIYMTANATKVEFLNCTNTYLDNLHTAYLGINDSTDFTIYASGIGRYMSGGNYILFPTSLEISNVTDFQATSTDLKSCFSVYFDPPIGTQTYCSTMSAIIRGIVNSSISDMAGGYVAIDGARNFSITNFNPNYVDSFSPHGGPYSSDFNGWNLSNSNNVRFDNVGAIDYGLPMLNVSNSTFNRLVVGSYCENPDGAITLNSSVNNTFTMSTITYGAGECSPPFPTSDIAIDNSSTDNLVYNSHFIISWLDTQIGCPGGSDEPGSYYINISNDTNRNYFNTTRQAGARVYSNGIEIGGNFYERLGCSAFGQPDAGGHSNLCADADKDGFCDSYFSLLQASGGSQACEGTPSCAGLLTEAQCTDNFNYIANPQCAWTPTSCEGTAPPCDDWSFDVGTCVSYTGCSWTGGSCTGDVWTCDTLSYDQGVCESQTGCSWEEEACTGTATACSTKGTIPTCWAHLGCSWTGGGPCVGTPPVCTTLENQTACSQAGCDWTGNPSCQVYAGCGPDSNETCTCNDMTGDGADVCNNQTGCSWNNSFVGLVVDFHPYSSKYEAPASGGSSPGCPAGTSMCSDGSCRSDCSIQPTPPSPPNPWNPLIFGIRLTIWILLLAILIIVFDYEVVGQGKRFSVLGITGFFLLVFAVIAELIPLLSGAGSL